MVAHDQRAEMNWKLPISNRPSKKFSQLKCSKNRWW